MALVAAFLVLLFIGTLIALLFINFNRAPITPASQGSGPTGTLVLASPMPEPGACAIVTAEALTLEVYLEPNGVTKITVTLSAGTTIFIQEKVTTADGTVWVRGFARDGNVTINDGWVRESSLPSTCEPTPSATRTPSPTATGTGSVQPTRTLRPTRTGTLPSGTIIPPTIIPPTVIVPTLPPLPTGKVPTIPPVPTIIPPTVVVPTVPPIPTVIVPTVPPVPTVIVPTVPPIPTIVIPTLPPLPTIIIPTIVIPTLPPLP
jgi:hypothetical protein